jgi:CBS domain-containing protein
MNGPAMQPASTGPSINTPDLRVRDFMQTDIVTVSPDITVRELTRVLSEEGISGVPVVDPSGEVLGVASSSDVVRAEAEADGTAVTRTRWVSVPIADETVDPEDEQVDPYSDYFLPEDAPVLRADWGDGEKDGPLDHLTAGEIMTPVTFSIGPDTRMHELAEFLVRGRIHRALVMEEGRLEGIVTTMDILRVIADGPPGSVTP